MTRYALRCTACALVLSLGLGTAGLAVAASSTPANGSATAAAEQTRTIAVAEGLSSEDAAAVADGMTVRIIGQYYSNLADAVEVANQNGGGTIALLADTVATDDIAKTATIGFRTSIIIKSEGDTPLTVYRAPGQTGPLLQMTDGTVSLKAVVFDGAGEEATSPAITISDQAVVKFGKDLTVTGNASNGADAAGKDTASAVSVSGKSASLTLKEGSSITGNAGSGSAIAAIYNDGATVVNEGGSVTNNTAEGGDNPNYTGTGKFKGEPFEA